MNSDGYGDGTQDQHAEAIRADSGDNVVIAGRFRGSIDFGATTIANPNGASGYGVRMEDSSAAASFSSASSSNGSWSRLVLITFTNCFLSGATSTRSS